MSSLFSSPEAPKPYAPPPPPEDPSVKAATQAKMQAAADQERKARGRASTLLTGSQGDTSQPSLSKRMLLGT